MKRMMVMVAVAVLLGAPSLGVLAQGTDFSGTWNLDRDSSELPQGRGGGRGRGGRGGGGGRGRGGFGGLMADTLVISQSASTVTVEQQIGDQSQTIEYALDGSETSVAQGRGTLTVTASWDGAALVTEGTQSIETGRGNFTLDITERRTLSSDGQTLTIEATRSTPRGDQSFRLVYQKAG
ncbi:MAG: hypothetical protein QGI10_08880 [Vicinamibacterales bacterium]|jgi:hypothetical protein|nr:hypothetical protein [Vicinamibacterales bacterium]HJN45798.1 hypothetical protein [Vicinamibacterales bacterium]